VQHKALNVHPLQDEHNDVEEWTKIDTKNDGFFVSRLEVRRLLKNVER
jgi:hypothetical protein